MAPSDGMPGPADPNLPVEIPDDASELEPDRLAWLAEERRRRTRARARRLIFTRRWERFGLSGPIVTICLLVTSGVAALAVVLVPRPRTPPPAPAPLAAVAVLSVPASSAGLSSGASLSSAPLSSGASPSGGGLDDALLGRLLPPVTLRDDTAGAGRPVNAEALRPALMLLVPDGCGCRDVVHALYLQGSEFRLPVWLIGGASSSDTAAADAGRVALANLDQDAAGGGARWAVDAEGALARAVSAEGLTAVLVGADGTLRSVRRSLPLDPARVPALEGDLARLPADLR